MLPGRNKTRKRDSVVGLDLGSQQLKAVLIHRTETSVELRQVAVVPSSVALGNAEAEPQMAEALQALLGQLKISDRRAFVAISTPSAFVAQIETPRMPPSEIRSSLVLNSARYLRRDLNGYYVDATELVDPATEGKGRKTATMQLLVAGAPKDAVVWCRNALTGAKMRAETIELSAVAVVNALQYSHPEVCEQNTVLLLDIGAQGTSLNFLRRGQPLLTRLMPFGGAQITEQIAAVLGVTPVAAEEQKRVTGKGVLPVMQGVLQVLARDVRSSIDFVERQYECEIRHAFVAGGSACNELLVETLGQEVGMHIERWSPAGRLQVVGEAAQLPLLAPSLAAAIGVAVGKL